MAQYYAYYACSGGATTPLFYSNTNPAFSTPPPAFIKITSDSTLDPDLIDQCFHLVIRNAEVPPSPLETITCLTATYETFVGCDECLTNTGAIILENCEDPLDVICLQPSAADFIGYYTQYNNKCYVVKEVLDCTVNVPISYSFSGNLYKTCLACKQSLPAVTYKLTNCNEPYNVTYTSTDLSASAGSVIQINDFTDCFYVEVISDSIPGIDVAITGGPFANCEDCQADYYLLTDCRGIQEPILTITDLSASVGEIITIEGCPDTCWEVSESQAGPNPITVNVTGNFNDCANCQAAVLPCRCQSAVNNSIAKVQLRYINCDGDQSSTDFVEIGARSKNYCVLYWVSGADIQDDGACIGTTSTDCIQYVITVPPLGIPQTLHYKDCFGNNQQEQFSASKAGVVVQICGIPGQTSQDIYITGPSPVAFTDGPSCTSSIYTCPTKVNEKPRRRVTPGYNTPACTAEYYENVECHFSEWMYKDVLEKRYGISNCCPEELIKWEIKHEMLMLDALVNPDYICQAISSCCEPIVNVCGSCGCQSSNCNC